MLRIICGTDIEYTKGDTFKLNVSPKIEFESDSQLDFILSSSENSEPIISNAYQLNSDNEFTVRLSDDDISKLKYANYIYKLILHTPDGEILTQKSGKFKSKWGA